IRTRLAGPAEEHPCSVAFSPDGKYRAVGYTGDNDARVRLWNVALKKEVTTLEMEIAGEVCVTFSPDGKFLVAGVGRARDVTRVGYAQVWKMPEIEPVAALRDFRGGVFTVAFSPDGKTLALGGGS